MQMGQVVCSGHGTNKQFILHVKKTYRTANKMGQIPAYYHATETLKEKSERKAVLSELAEGIIKKADAEKMTAVTLAGVWGSQFQEKNYQLGDGFFNFTLTFTLRRLVSPETSLSRSRQTCGHIETCMKTNGRSIQAKY